MKRDIKDRADKRENRQPLLVESDRHLEEVESLSEKIIEKTPESAELARQIIDDTRETHFRTRKFFYSAIQALAANIRNEIRSRPRTAMGSTSGFIAIVWIVFATNLMEPTSAPGYFAKGDTLAQSRRFEDAEQVNARALSKFPHDVSLLVQRVELLKATGKFGQALTHLDRHRLAIEQDPHWKFVANYLEESCRLSQKAFEGGLR